MVCSLSVVTDDESQYFDEQSNKPRARAIVGIVVPWSLFSSGIFHLREATQVIRSSTLRKSICVLDFLPWLLIRND